MTTTIPDAVRGHLLSGFIDSETRTLLQYGAQRGNMGHVGGPMGRVVAWLWCSSPNETMSFLADLLIELRRSTNPPIEPNDLLGAQGLGSFLTADEFAELTERARDEVPRRCGLIP